MKQIFVAVLLLYTLSANAQKTPKKYPSLLWEITGNGLKKPSYLFGTMHVSSKTVFHLSDSFYNAMRSVEVVALELNPQDWQKDMYYLQDGEKDLKNYTSGSSDDYLSVNSFKIEKYEDEVKYALNSEPQIINSLLYRTYKGEQDYEENTYLDLYIYQTGMKLGKRAAGVENFLETEKIMIEAYRDMANEKTKKYVNYYDEDMYDIQKKMQDAYRQGDLDLLDSLNKLTTTSEAFAEKFLYKRNEIQANSMDTIMKKNRLFVGVGAAHLPGERGVIEMLRKMGYKLRPIKMVNRDAAQKDAIDKIRVPIKMDEVKTTDGTITMQVPGKMYKQSSYYNNWQYADMENGSYYMLTRVSTNASLFKHDTTAVMEKIDSMLYENIPGKIIKKTLIRKNGYPGYDITNRTRRGDIQRYNILVTPYEVLVFKMSGNDEYVSGKEANTFFNSINIKSQSAGWNTYSPPSGGFKVDFPKSPNITFNSYDADRNLTWKYEASDDSKNAYTLIKKSLHNFSFLEEDTFDISLIEESFKATELIAREVKREFTKHGRHSVLNMEFITKDSMPVYAKATLNGPNYYLLTAFMNNKTDKADKFLNSFAFTDFVYTNPTKYTDTFYKFSVNTSVIPKTNDELRRMMLDEEKTSEIKYSKYWPQQRFAKFQHDTTGEAVFVVIKEFPKYYYIKDSASFWKDQFFPKEDNADIEAALETAVAASGINFEGLNLSSLYNEYYNSYAYNKMKVGEKKVFDIAGYPAASMQYTDTGSTKKIDITAILQKNRMISFYTLSDSASKSTFLNSFLTSFKPEPINSTYSVFVNKIDTFFADFYSEDSVVRKQAQEALVSINYGEEGVDKIKHIIKGLKLTDKKYFETKTSLYRELSYIKDDCCRKEILDFLKDEYAATADTAYFQNEILLAISRQKTKESTELFKKYLLENPPVYESSYTYDNLFSYYYDSLSLAKHLFPEVLQLMNVTEYKEPVMGLLAEMVDSGYIKPKEYNDYYSKLYYDSKILLKKQQLQDELSLQKELKKLEDEDNSYSYYDYNYSSYNKYTSETGDYVRLLMPFYNKPDIANFYEKLLQSRDDDLKLLVAIKLLQNNKAIPDTLFTHLAKTDKSRYDLYSSLKTIKKENLFPREYKTQELLARANLLADKNKQKFDTIVYAGKEKVQIKDKTGWVYFFKYKERKEDEWKMGISGLQPEDENLVTINGVLVSMTDKKFKTDKTEDEQFREQLKQMIFALRPSAKYFFSSNNYGYNYNYNYDYDYGD